MQLKDPNVLEATLIEKFENNGENFYELEIQYNVIDEFKQFINDHHHDFFQKFLESNGAADKAEELVERPSLTGLFEFKQNSNRIHLKLRFMSALFNGLSSIAVDAINLDAHKAILKGQFVLSEKQLHDVNVLNCIRNQLSNLSFHTDFDLHVHSNASFKSFDEIAYDEVWGPSDELGTLWFDCVLTDDRYLSVGLFNRLADAQCQSLIVTNDEGVQIDDHVENFENYRETLVELLSYGEFTWHIADGEMSQYVETLINDYCAILKDQLNKQNLNEFMTLAFASEYISKYSQ